MSLADVQSQAGSQTARTKLVHDGPTMIQEVVWWPWESSGPSSGEGLWQILFNFHDGRLYRIEATYDRQATRGLTPEDMIQAVSALYGSPTRLQSEGGPAIHVDDSTDQALAQWEDRQFSYTLYRSSLSDAYGLIMFSKQMDAEAIMAKTASETVAKQDATRTAAASREQAAEELEAARRRNKKTIRP
jgi:hypothetical protein